MLLECLKRLIHHGARIVFIGCIPAFAQIVDTTKAVIPSYPAVALASGLQGKITFEIKLTKGGDVGSVVVLESFTKVTAVTKPLINALSHWRFTPGSAVTRVITFEFLILPHKADINEELSEISSAGVVLVKKRAIQLEQNHGY